MLKKGQIVTCELSKEKMEVRRKLGEGGQGIVYLVEGKNGRKALKWYNAQYATNEQKRNISALMMKGRPWGEAGQRFVWPEDIVTVDSSNKFGYLMDLIDTSRYAELGEVFSHLKSVPTAYAKCRISENLAGSYKQLHVDGYCYRDISAGNLMFDPRTGDVLICDNDNVGVQNYSRSLVSGTLEFMAPELINGNAEPSVETDLHSLAVLLFHLWVWHNPLHGLREYNIRSWDLPAKRKVYGENPLFIFDPDNHDNCLPNDPEYNTPLKFWNHCPEPLKRMFTRAFTNGLKNPYERVNEGEWKNLFLELGDCIIHCPRDNAEVFWYEGAGDLKCWYCKEDVDVPVRLVMNTKSGRRYVLLTKDAKLLERHINLYADEKKRNNILGDLVQNSSNPSVWGLRNLTDLTWLLTLADGTVKEVPPNRSAPLSRGAVLNFGNEATGTFEK